MTTDSQYLADFYDELAGMAAGFKDAVEIDPHTRSRVGDTPLHIAAIRGDTRAICLLLGLGADINAAGERGYTALHYAVEQKHPEVVSLLLEHGADSSLRSEFGDTPLDLSREWDDDIYQILQQHAA